MGAAVATVGGGTVNSAMESGSAVAGKFTQFRVLLVKLLRAWHLRGAEFCARKLQLMTSSLIPSVYGAIYYIFVVL